MDINIGKLVVVLAWAVLIVAFIYVSRPPKAVPDNHTIVSNIHRSYSYTQFRLDVLNPNVPIEDILDRCGGVVPRKELGLSWYMEPVPVGNDGIIATKHNRWYVFLRDAR